MVVYWPKSNVFTLCSHSSFHPFDHSPVKNHNFLLLQRLLFFLPDLRCHLCPQPKISVLFCFQICLSKFSYTSLDMLSHGGHKGNMLDPCQSSSNKSLSTLLDFIIIIKKIIIKKYIFFYIFISLFIFLSFPC